MNTTTSSFNQYSQHSPATTSVAIIVAATATISTTASTATASPRLGFIDTKGASIDFHSIELVAGLFGIAGRHGHKAKASDLARVAIGGHEAIVDGSLLFKEATNFGFGSVTGSRKW